MGLQSHYVGQSGLSTLQNASSVLRLFASGSADISVTEVHRLLDMPKSSAGRLLQHMRMAGFLDLVGTGPRYRLGSVVLDAARADRERSSLASVAEVLLSEICRATGHTGYISALVGNEIMVLRSCPGTKPLQVITPLGQKSPAAETAIGRALLAHIPRKSLDKLYGEWHAPRSSRSPSTFDGLRDELANVRAAGYAESHDEAVPGVGSTAVAISDRDGSEMLGICVSYPASDTSAHEKALIARTMLELIDVTAARAGEPIRVKAGGSIRNVMKNV